MGVLLGVNTIIIAAADGKIKNEFVNLTPRGGKTPAPLPFSARNAPRRSRKGRPGRGSGKAARKTSADIVPCAGGAFCREQKEISPAGAAGSGKAARQKQKNAPRLRGAKGRIRFPGTKRAVALLQDFAEEIL